MSYLIVKWNSFSQEDSRRMVVRLAEAALYTSLAPPGTKEPATPEAERLGRSEGRGQRGFTPAQHRSLPIKKT
jgi:hypothetical protein